MTRESIKRSVRRHLLNGKPMELPAGWWLILVVLGIIYLLSRLVGY